MAKYVIEIEDVPFGRNDDPVIPHGMDELYRARGFKSLVFDQNGLDKLTLYTEPDEIKNNKVNLCTSCELYKEHFPECGDVNVLFGDGVGNDNICCCNKYEPYTEPDEDESYGVNRYKAIGLAFLKWLGNDVGDKLKSADDVYQFLDKNCYNKDAVEQEVWEFAGEFYNADREVKTLFDCDLDDICKKYTYSEAKAKYESWRKQNDEIRVGDEVEYECGGDIVRFVVTGFCGETAFGVKYQCDYDDVGEFCDIEDLRKTGRHFYEIEELLKKMKEE